MWWARQLCYCSDFCCRNPRCQRWPWVGNIHQRSFGSEITHYRRANVVVALAIAALASRPLLSSLATADGSRTIHSAASNRTMLLMLYVLVGLVTLLWYREKFGDRRTALLFGLGSLAQALLDCNAWQGDPWKFAFAWPIAIVVLAGTGKKRELHALAALCGISLLFDFRSFAGLCLLALLIIFWRRSPSKEPVRIFRPFLVVSLLTVIMVQIGTYVAVAGLLGGTIQERTVAQTQGGRLLWSALVLNWRPASASPLSGLSDLLRELNRVPRTF